MCVCVCVEGSVWCGHPLVGSVRSIDLNWRELLNFTSWSLGAVVWERLNLPKVRGQTAWHVLRGRGDVDLEVARDTAELPVDRSSGAFHFSQHPEQILVTETVTFLWVGIN